MLARIKCPPWVPYCSEGRCSTQPPKDCGSSPELSAIPKRSELCPATGYFPNPIQCNQYHLCDSELRALPYMCPELYVYDPLTNLCKFFRQSSDCPVLDCQKHLNRFTAYPLEASLYTFCTYFEGRLHLSLHQCPSEMVFDPSSQTCVYGCMGGEGKFAHPQDRNKYFLCLRNQLGQVLYFLAFGHSKQTRNITKIFYF